MANTVLRKKIEKCLSDLQSEANSIIVVKGIPMEEILDPLQAVDLNYDEIIKNKMSYFMKLYTSQRKFITYEEFLILKDFILSQYATVYIINNNIYMEQYPINLYCSNSSRNGLLIHFADSIDIEDDRELGNISELAALFVGIKEYNGYLLGVYYDENILNNDKVFIKNLFDESTMQIEKEKDVSDFFEIVEEADYINVVKHLLSDEPTNLCVRISNFTGNTDKLINHLQILAENWSDYTDFSIFQTGIISESNIHRHEFTDILKKYWGYESFRNIQIYDMIKLDEGIKDVVKVSQEEIISTMVNQVENCIKSDKDFRDIFITAPTGAGKSVMFQIPAIYLAEKYNLLTIVISPLIGLMNDQVKNLELKKYTAAKTINSDISPIIKEEIIEKVSNSEYHILYLSPETLLSRSDIEQLIGNRTIGMIIIDEAHIVTTWGKQFRPDYWYLGDHIKKLRKNQLKKKNQAFTVATFTATAIYGGIEDMYHETQSSLHMLNPITYLGYIKRDDINISIRKKEKEKNLRNEYELDKFDHIIKLIQRSMITGKKTLIYFPTVALIDRCMDYLMSKKIASGVSKYYGTLSKDKKTENYEQFLDGTKKIMLATKAFGMGIDIDDIEIVAHFAPTGNVCDYVQEIGRAARRKELQGEAEYLYDSRDFKHINRLHGMSMIQTYQIVEVIKKIEELYRNNLKNVDRNSFTKKRNSMLLDAENFTYIFKSPIGDEEDNINKVKTALLIIQKNFENHLGFSPINVRPIPLFSIGFFEISLSIQKKILEKYPDTIEEINSENHICRVLLDKIWKKSYSNYSFANFKFLIYSKSKKDDFDFNDIYPMKPALCVTLNFNDDSNSIFNSIWSAIKLFINDKIITGEYISVNILSEYIASKCNINKYTAISICEVVVSSMIMYRKDFNPSISNNIIKENKTSNDGRSTYQFQSGISSYFNWVEKKYYSIKNDVKNDELYLINDDTNIIKETSTILGILESMNVLSFKMIGGANSQIYIYINQIQSLRNIINNPTGYKNRLLETVNERHIISVKMLTYIYESNFTSKEIWEILENYFLGMIPEIIKKECNKEKPDMFN